MRVGKNKNGFTIVELLIVIVVIAILAAITLVTYNGIQTNASNSALKSAASQSLKLLTSYVSAENAYPPFTPIGTVYSDFICLTVESGCYTNATSKSGDPLLTAALLKVGKLPGTVYRTGSDRYGVMFHYHSSRTVNGVSQPAAIVYYLQGRNQDCGVSGVIEDVAATNLIQTVSSTNKYSNGDAQGKTVCYITIPGPSAP